MKKKQEEKEDDKAKGKENETEVWTTLKSSNKFKGKGVRVEAHEEVLI